MDLDILTSNTNKESKNEYPNILGLDDDEDEEKDEDEKIEKHDPNKFGILLDKIEGRIYKGGLYKISLSKFCKLQIKQHPLNREVKVDDSHIKIIKQGIIRDGLLNDPIQLVIDKNNNIYIASGHHRYIALTSINKESKGAFNINFYLQIFNVDEHDDENVLKLMEKSNNVKKISLDDFPGMELRNGLRKCYQETVEFDGKKFFRDKNKDEPVNRPFVNRGIMYQWLKKNSNIKKLKYDDIYGLIMYINNLLSKKPKSFFGKNVSDKSYQKAVDNNFFLGLKKENDIYFWLDSKCLDIYYNDYKKNMKKLNRLKE